MHDDLGLGMAFNVNGDRFPCHDDDLGDALVRKAVVDDFLAGIASHAKHKDFHGVVMSVTPLGLALSIALESRNRYGV